jgi:hypothetical protein
MVIPDIGFQVILGQDGLLLEGEVCQVQASDIPGG